MNTSTFNKEKHKRISELLAKLKESNHKSNCVWQKEDIDTMMDLYRAGASSTAIANAMGVSIHQIRKLASKRRMNPKDKE